MNKKSILLTTLPTLFLFYHPGVFAGCKAHTEPNPKTYGPGRPKLKVNCMVDAGSISFRETSGSSSSYRGVLNYSSVGWGAPLNNATSGLGINLRWRDGTDFSEYLAIEKDNRSVKSLSGSDNSGSMNITLTRSGKYRYCSVAKGPTEVFAHETHAYHNVTSHIKKRGEDRDCVTVTAVLNPTSVSVPSVDDDGDGKFTVSWARTPGVDKYKIYRWHNGSRKYLTSYSSSTTHTDSNLPEGKYQYEVQTCLGSKCSVGGQGTKSNYISVYRSPPKPSSIIAGSVDDEGSISISWPKTVRSASYVFQYKENQNAWISTPKQTQTSKTMSVNDRSSYQFRVQACHSRKRLKCSAFSEPTAPIKTIYVPGVPNNFHLPNSTKELTFNLSWTKADNLEQYFEVFDSKGKLYQSQLNETKLSIQVSEPGNYGYKIRACSLKKKCSNFTPLKFVKVVEKLPKPKIPNIKAPASPSAKFNVAWNKVAHATWYLLKVSQNGVPAQPVKTTHNSYEQAAPTTTTTFKFEIQACNIDFCSDYSSPYESKFSKDPTKLIRKALYYNEADNVPADKDATELNVYSRDKAAFRYLDLMYRLDTNNKTVINFYTRGDATPPFNSLYGDDERARIRQAILDTQSLLAKEPSNEKVQRLLLDIYHDQLVAEVTLANIAMDRARIQRLRAFPTRGDSTLSSLDSDLAEDENLEGRDLLNVRDRLKVALSQYWQLIESHPQLIIKFAEQRGQTSPRYVDANDVSVPVVTDKQKLFTGYKDIVAFYEMMVTYAKTSVSYARFSVINGQTNESLIQELLDDSTLLQRDLKCYDARLTALFSRNSDTFGQDKADDICALTSDDYAQFVIENKNQGEDIETIKLITHQIKRSVFENVKGFSGLPEKLNEFDLAIQSLHQSQLWLSGHLNIFGLPEDAVFVQHRSRESENTQFHSFDTLLDRISNTYLPEAQQAYDKAFGSYESFRRSRDTLATDFTDRFVSLNNGLESLIGWRYHGDCDGNACIISEDSKGKASQIFRQSKSIEYALNAVKDSEIRLENLAKSIEIEIERHRNEVKYSEQLGSIYLQYGEKYIDIENRITQIRVEAAKKKKKWGAIGGIVKTTTGFLSGRAPKGSNASFDPTQGINELTNTIVNAQIANAEIGRIRQEGELRALRQRLIAEEKADVVANNIKQLKNNFSARIQNMVNEMNRLEIGVTQAEIVLETEQDKLLSLLHDAAQKLNELQRVQSTLVDRYFADPIHSHNLSSDLLTLEKTFNEAMKWTYFAVNALEYKFEEKFKYEGTSKQSLYRIKSAPELRLFILAMNSYNQLKMNSWPENIQTDIVSIKRHIFGYIKPRSNSEAKIYTHPNPQGTGLLTDRNAFEEKLKTLTVYQKNNKTTWVSIPFDTSKEIGSTLFVAPVFNDDSTGNQCVMASGNYLDRIDSIGVIVELYDNYDELDPIQAYLTYGGTSFGRSKHLTSIEESFREWSPHFWSWDQENNTFKRVQSFRRLTNAVIQSNEYKPAPRLDYAFKEQSVAATGWRLSLKVKTPFYDIRPEDIKDIKLVINHRYKEREVNSDLECSSEDEGPLLLLR